MLRVITFITAVLLCTQPANADWKLDPSASGLYFVSTKADRIAEVHTFNTLSGAVAADGKVSLTIDLASVSTGIPIRDQRMREHLFVVAEHPRAMVYGELALQQFLEMPVGGIIDTLAPFAVTVHGVRQSMDVAISVLRLSENRYAVISSKPVLVSAGSFELLEGLKKLQELAGLSSISPAVPVSFRLTFESE